MYQRLSEYEQQQITKDYVDGMNLYMICQKYDISTARACYVAKNNGASRRTHSPVSVEQQKQIAQEYSSGAKVTELCAKYFTNHSSVYGWIKKYGKPKHRRNIAMIMHDWNASVPVHKIVETYGFRNVLHFTRSRRWYRVAGYAFRDRTHDKNQERGRKFPINQSLKMSN